MYCENSFESIYTGIKTRKFTKIWLDIDDILGDIDIDIVNGDIISDDEDDDDQNIIIHGGEDTNNGNVNSFQAIRVFIAHLLLVKIRDKKKKR
jgi:hypothetical protein